MIISTVDGITIVETDEYLELISENESAKWNKESYIKTIDGIEYKVIKHYNEDIKKYFVIEDEYLVAKIINDDLYFCQEGNCIRIEGEEELKQEIMEK